MSETYQPYFESTSEREDDKKEDKKDQKKRAARAVLHAPRSAEHARSDRPQKLGGELLRPLAIELPKQPDPETEIKNREHQPAETHTESVVLPQELQPANDELLVATPEASDDDDEETEKTKKHHTEAETDRAEVTSHEVSDLTTEAPNDTEAAFEEIVEAPDLDDLADAPHKKPVYTAPEASTDKVPDKVFGGIAAVLPGESAPGVPPVEMDAGGTEPPIPPTAEGVSWDDEPWERPAGGLGTPATREAINAVDNRRELDDLYHTSRENGLAGAVGIIGLGLILEHFAAKRRDKRLKRQLDAQNRQLRKTNEALQVEQRSHMKTQQKVEQLHTAQATSREQLQRATLSSIEKSAEVAAAAVTGSVIGRAAERGKTKITPAQERVLAERLKHSRELGRAIKQNPELKDVHGLKQTLEVASATANQQERQIDGLKREVSYEQLQRKQADTDRSPRVAGGGGVDAGAMPVLPSPQHQLTTGLEPDHLLEAHAHPDKKPPLNSLTWVALATVLVIVAAVIVMVYVR